MDTAGQKGTGRWTVMSALELGVAIPTIYAAVNARIMSSMKDERVAASKELSGPSGKFEGDVAAYGEDFVVDGIGMKTRRSDCVSYSIFTFCPRHLLHWRKG